MENKDKTPVTPESILEIIREVSLSIKESRAEIKESRAEIKESRAEIKESREAIKESGAEFDRKLAESRAEWKLELAESRAKWNIEMKELKEMVGGSANSNGLFAEEFFFNSIERGDKILFGEKFDECYSSLKRYNKNNRKKSEHDILLVNGKSLAIVEVKYKARKEDIQKIIKKLPDFRTLYPQYESHRIYLGLAAMSFENDVENESASNGIAIIKQVGDTFVIHDEHMKVY